MYSSLVFICDCSARTSAESFGSQELPENDAYWPPLQIRAIEHSTFGYENLIGVRVVPNPHAYYMNEEMLQERTSFICVPRHYSASPPIGIGNQLLEQRLGFLAQVKEL